MSNTVPVWAEWPAPTLLLVNGRPTGLPLWLARRRQERLQGLRGTKGLSGGVWITACNAVHCIGMSYPIDVVHVTRNGTVIDVGRMRPGSIGMPRFKAHAVLELPAGMAQELGIRRGAVVAPGHAVEVPKAPDADHPHEAVGVRGSDGVDSTTQFVLRP
ncbi:Uncharacterized ACR, COG1430 [Actinomyces bovis]|uniref:Uncharacterized ACR, COG1430 n=1 Tax=Actinomyces bovis TaxID=1658 RepID=A0ABY1VMQ7_9ACTO|nr:DUF192 domain-containing protein [Actinomyces bovis]SPT52971.1 Uncharacterized ACR, COG1430 [Actinomyces bovis]VEG55182.1 Uncharacterized ACR, COG1430 [Actinomyces israelii]